MRVLILSANTGGGHNSTAGALAEQLEKMGVEFEIADALSMISAKVSQFVSWGHSYVYRHLPSLFGHVYRYEERHPAKFIYEQCAKGQDGSTHNTGKNATLGHHVARGLGEKFK